MIEIYSQYLHLAVPRRLELVANWGNDSIRERIPLVGRDRPTLLPSTSWFSSHRSFVPIQPNRRNQITLCRTHFIHFNHLRLECNPCPSSCHNAIATIDQFHTRISCHPATRNTYINPTFEFKWMTDAYVRYVSPAKWIECLIDMGICWVCVSRRTGPMTENLQNNKTNDSIDVVHRWFQATNGSQAWLLITFELEISWFWHFHSTVKVMKREITCRRRNCKIKSK